MALTIFNFSWLTDLFMLRIGSDKQYSFPSNRHEYYTQYRHVSRNRLWELLHISLPFNNKFNKSTVSAGKFDKQKVTRWKQKIIMYYHHKFDSLYWTRIPYNEMLSLVCPIRHYLHLQFIYICWYRSIYIWKININISYPLSVLRLWIGRTKFNVRFAV
jgi:hypothetical protein